MSIELEPQSTTKLLLQREYDLEKRIRNTKGLVTKLVLAVLDTPDFGLPDNVVEIKSLILKSIKDEMESRT